MSFGLIANPPAPKPTFEESLAAIEVEVNKRRGKWTLSSLPWLDYDDVAQIIKIHIWRKWHLYDHTRPLAPWVNRVISSQMKNLLRNVYGSHCRPCISLRCAANEGDDLCSIYGKQCSDCPLYANWAKTKKAAHDIKMALPLENHAQEVFDIPGDGFDLEKAAENLHERMSKLLRPIEWRVYKHLYVDNLPEETLAKLMGYKTTEKNRSPGYKSVKNLKKSIVIKVKRLLMDGNSDIF